MIHGGDVYTDGILKGKSLMDYSSNINPLGVPKTFENSMEKALRALVRYPDIQYRELKSKISEYLGTKEEYILLGNGAAEILDLSESLVSNIVISAPGFSEYELNAKKWEAKIEYTYLKESRVYKYEKSHTLEYDYEDILNKLKINDGIIIANPNNPNGGVLDKKCFREILDFCEENNKIIIIDEAFIEFVDNESQSFVYEVERYKCLIVVRALTKFYGMPGIRFGYGITSNVDMKKSIENKQNPWNINTFAEEAAKEVLFDEEYKANTYEWIRNERERFEAELNNIDILNKVYRSKGNYFLCECKITAEDLYVRMRENGILIRKADNYEGLTKNHVRFALKDRENNEAFLNVLRRIKF